MRIKKSLISLFTAIIMVCALPISAAAAEPDIVYKETGDIYLVADVLGHKDVNTTRKHYAAMDDNRRRRAASAVRLRETK